VQSYLGDDVNGAVALELSGRDFRQRLDQIESCDWTRSTPCDDWSVRDLANHVIGGNFRYVMILSGEPADKILGTRDNDWLGADPLGSFDDGFARVTQKFSAPGILRASVRHPKSGAMTGAVLRVLRVNELTVHGWDLARAIGSDDRLNEGLVLWLLQHLEPLRSTIAASGLCKAGVADDMSAASPQARLLNLFGRAG
jgi:uncharacterized protein (TIGR03086 family)